MISFKGPAGAGKTELMTEAVTAIESLSGKRVMILAPSSPSVEVLRAQGFARAEHFAAIRTESRDLQQAVKGQVLWVDEAGFLSVRQMLELQEFAVEHNCRLVLTGDTKQHHSVQWGDALRILERSGVIAQAVLTKIHRQRIPELREAIEDLSKGRTTEGFDKLDKFGAIQEIPDDAGRLAAIAEKQIEALKAQRSVFDHSAHTWRVPGYSRRRAKGDERERSVVRLGTFRHAASTAEPDRLPTT